MLKYALFIKHCKVSFYFLFFPIFFIINNFIMATSSVIDVIDKILVPRLAAAI